MQAPPRRRFGLEATESTIDSPKKHVSESGKMPDSEC
jgi:hypothetical protein